MACNSKEIAKIIQHYQDLARPPGHRGLLSQLKDSVEAFDKVLFDILQ